jgi:ribonuclease HI
MKLTIHLRTGTKGQSAYPVAVGVIVESEDPFGVRYAAGHLFTEARRSVAEVMGLLEAIKAAKASNPEDVTILADSENLVKRVTGELFDSEPEILEAVQLVQAALLALDVWTIKHSPKDDIGKAERLVRTALDAGKTVVVVDEQRPENATGFEPLAPDLEVLKKAADAPSGPGKKRMPLDEGGDGEPASGPRAKPAANAGGVNNPRFKVIVDSGAACPHGSTDGRVHQFGPCTPAEPGLCVFATAAAFSIDPLHWRSPNHRRIVTTCAVCKAGVSVEPG